jgi:AhpC/TSA family
VTALHREASTGATFIAEATDTRRSDDVPPKSRMVFPTIAGSWSAATLAASRRHHGDEPPGTARFARLPCETQRHEPRTSMTSSSLIRSAILLSALCVAPALAEGPAHTPTPPGAAATQPSAELGKPAPDFTLTDTEGKPVRLRDLKGKTVVLEWFNPECPFVKHAHGKGPLVDLARRVAGPKLVWLSINSGAPGKQGHGREVNALGKKTFSIDNPVLLDETGVVGKAYGAIKTPHVFVIDPKGVLVYRGGVDNAPMGVPDDARPRPSAAKPGELVAYLENALGELRGKRAVALSDTPPYGCSVKYAD